MALETKSPSSEGAYSWNPTEFDVAPRVACATCNNEWMDRLDRDAEAIVEPMVIGQRTTIRKLHAQKTVASWVSQLAFIIDHTQTVPVIPVSLARKFRDDLKPIEGIVVWLAWTSDDWMLNGWIRYQILGWGPLPDPEYPNACLVTFRIKNLVLQAWIPLEDSVRRDLGITRGENMRFLSQLWPSRYMPVSWPPSTRIASESLATFASTFEP